MATLTGCIKSVGDSLHPDDKVAIMARVRELKAGGLAVDEATRQAVKEQSAKLGEPRELFQATGKGTPLSVGTTHLEVNGKQVPALNSEGRPIHPTEEGIKNF